MAMEALDRDGTVHTFLLARPTGGRAQGRGVERSVPPAFVYEVFERGPSWDRRVATIVASESDEEELERSGQNGGETRPGISPGVDRSRCAAASRCARSPDSFRTGRRRARAELPDRARGLARPHGGKRPGGS